MLDFVTAAAIAVPERKSPASALTLRGDGRTVEEFDMDKTTRRSYRTPQEAFAARTERQGDCLVWTGWSNGKGYGRIMVNGRGIRAHRFAWEQAYGPIPEGMVIDHMCHNTSCCELTHLRLATLKQNQENRKTPPRTNTSGVMGVSQWKGKWKAQVSHHNKKIHVGFYDNIQDAEAAVIAKRLELFTHNDHDRAA